MKKLAVAIFLLTLGLLLETTQVQAQNTPRFLFKFGTPGTGDGEFNRPLGITSDSTGNIYVVDGENDRIQVFTSTGDFLTKFGTTGSGDGQFSSPHDISIDSSGNVYVVDNGNNRVQVFSGSSPSILTVTKTADTNDGACDADCSLREAISVANPGDTITFSVTGTITLTGGELTIDKDLTIDGPGSSQLSISGNHASRVFDISSGTITITGVTIEQGTSTDGGGIFNAGTLDLIDIVLRDSRATNGNFYPSGGGGIYNTGTLNLTGAVLRDNRATNFCGLAGGIFNAGTLNLTESTLSNNTAGDAGGGIINDFGATLNITDSTFDSNSGGSNCLGRFGSGGGMYNNGTLVLTRSTFSNNSTVDDGGGIRNNGTLTASDSTFSNNSAVDVGGAIFSPSSASGRTTIINSTVTNNLANQGGGIKGDPGTVEMVNTIIAGNSASTSTDCSGSPTSLGHNLIGDATTCSFTAATGDLVGTGVSPIDPKLGPLQDNGGLTSTHALLPGSPAIDAGDNASCQATDQRGVSRPQGAGCDIGAYEFQLTANQPPVADAGQDQIVTDADNDGSENVTLDGSGSFDPDGSIVDYSWSEGGSVIGTGISPTVSFSVGTHTVILTVTDDQGATDSDEVVIVVQDAGAISCASVIEISQLECEALVTLYNSTDGTNWINNSGWLKDNTPCSWFGVTCGSGHITQLRLQLNQLNGEIPSQLGNLSHLTALALWSNQLSGSIPPELGNLRDLFEMDLHDNQLTGSIPRELGSLGNLMVWLLLHHNKLSGSIPPELGSLTNLAIMRLDDNQLSGIVPPELGNLTNLSILGLQDNQLSGGVPPELGNLTNRLTVLTLSGNQQLSGALPQSLAQLNLTVFRFDQTNLCEPPDADFQTWLNGISNLQRTGVLCTPPPSNQSPTANAGTDQTVTDADNDGTENVTLDGLASFDPDGVIVDYSWSEGGSVIATGVSPTVPFSVGTYTVTLTVTDDQGATDTDNVTITINPASIVNHVKVTNAPLGSWRLRQTPGTQNTGKILMEVPNDWVLELISTTDSSRQTVDVDGFIWWQVKTQGVNGWMAAQTSDGSEQYLVAGDTIKVSELTMAATRADRIIDVVNHYYNDSNTVLSLYSGRDGSNSFDIFNQIGLPVDVVLAMAAQESGLFDFDNEVYGEDFAGNLRNGGVGIMQVTSDRGSGSRLRYIDLDIQASPQLFPYSGGLRRKHTYYTNSDQGIFANIKDALRILQDKIAASDRIGTQNCPKNEPDGSGNILVFSCADIKRILTVWLYNGRDPTTTYLSSVANRLENLGTFFSGRSYNNADSFIEKLRTADQDKDRILLQSPGNLQVMDSLGNVTGLVNGVVVEDIPNSIYDSQNESIFILFPSGDLEYRVVGTGSDTYGLTIDSSRSGTNITFNAIDIPIVGNEIHQYTIDPGALLGGQNGVTLNIDTDGDGSFDKAVASDFDLTQSEFINAVNADPIANAGPDQNLNFASGGVQFTLDASGSFDPDGDPLTFTWIGPFIEGGGNITGLNPMVTLPFAGSFNITLMVDDGNGGIDTDTVTINIAATCDQGASINADLDLEDVSISQLGAIKNVAGTYRNIGSDSLTHVCFQVHLLEGVVSQPELQNRNSSSPPSNGATIDAPPSGALHPGSIFTMDYVLFFPLPDVFSMTLDAFTLSTISDTDADGLSDFDEINIHMTDPNDADTDDDGVSDGAEVAQGTDPNLP